MSPEKLYEKTEEGPHFPAEELKNWVETNYTNEEDQYAQKLKQVHIKAIEKKDVVALHNLSNVLFVRKSFIQNSSPDEYRHLTEVYSNLMEWLKPRLKDVKL